MDLYRSNVKYNYLQKFLIKLHKRSHLRRISILADEYAFILKDKMPGEKIIRCLDIGCGDMKIAKMLNLQFPQTRWVCVDTFKNEEKLNNSKLKYLRYDGVLIPYECQNYDFVLFSDVLHHVDGNKYTLLEQASAISKFIIIKDHFENGFFSRSILQLMDLFGNWGHKISIPSKYFTVDSFKLLCSNLSLKDIEIKHGIDLYSKNYILNKILNKNMQFIAVLTT
jgi:hypothetical protein|tara:strand:+ start:2838 stop:3509 length:672 start_codon:yes stop_codon:yes gene_type:complete